MAKSIFQSPATVVDSTDKVLWTGKKRPFFGQPWSFTRYTVLTDRLMVNRGFLTLRQEEMRLYRIIDVTVRVTLFQRPFGVGSVIIRSNDATAPKFIIEDIRDAQKVARLLSDLAEGERASRGITAFDCFQGYY